MTSSPLAKLVVVAAIALSGVIGTATGAHAQLFGQGNTAPPTPPTTSNPVVPVTPTRPRMQASVQITGAEVFGGTLGQWQQRKHVLEQRYSEYANHYNELMEWSRTGPVASRGYYRQQAQSTYATIQRIVAQHRYASMVIAKWHSRTTFVYYTGPNDTRYPRVDDPYAYLRANPTLLGTRVVARTGF